MLGGLSFVPRSTTHPSLSASAVMSNGTLTDSNPNSSAWAHPRRAIMRGSLWASGQDAPVASIMPTVADCVKIATGGVSGGLMESASRTRSLGVMVCHPPGGYKSRPVVDSQLLNGAARIRAP